MYKTFLFYLFLFFGLVHSPAQTNVIFDTDIDSDVDDVEALAMLLALHQKGKINLLGVIVTSDDPYAASCVSAINNYFGYPDIPIGFLRSQDKLRNHSKYTRQIAEAFNATITTAEQARDGTALYRQLLAQAADGSVTIVTVGHLSSLQQLLQSGADQNSPLTGRILVEAKVKQWLCMGGQFPEGKEANFYRPDPASTRYCLENWTRPVIFCGWEVGNRIITGGDYLKARLSPENPVYQAYRHYNNFAGRPSWDQVAVLLLLPRSKRYFEFSEPGYCQIGEDGGNTWLAKPRLNLSHRYVLIKEQVQPEKIARYVDNLVIWLSRKK